MWRRLVLGEVSSALFAPAPPGVPKQPVSGGGVPTSVLEKRDEAKQHARVCQASPDIRWDQIEQFHLPAPTHHNHHARQEIPEEHQGRSTAHAITQMAPSLHHNARDDAADQRCQRWDDQSNPGGRRRIAAHGLEIEWDHEHVLLQCNC